MKTIAAILGIIMLFSFSTSQTINVGSRSLLHTHTGRVLNKGALEVKTNMNFYTQLAEYLTTPPSGATDHNMYLVAGNIVLTYGLFSNFDLTVAPRIYQDTHRGDKYNLPDDIFVSLKAGSFGFGNRKFYGSGMLNFRIPTGDMHNYPYAEYASGAFEYGLMTAFSYYNDPYLPDRAFSTHINLGWYTHNEAGKTIYGNHKSEVNATELQYGLGFAYPVDLFDFSLEVNGINYLTQPDSGFVYSRESWLYVTPAVKYKPYRWFSIDLGMNIRVSGSNTDKKTVHQNINVNTPMYVPWRVQLGMNFKILPLPTGPTSPAEIEREQFKRRVDFFQSIIEERERVEEVQEELEQLKREREEAEKELEELKQILEEEG
jgi:hypothetical protein